MSTAFDIVQNPALGAHSLWTFTSAYFARVQKKRGPRFALAFIVLPIVFNEEAAETIASKNLDGGLFRALADDRALFLNLQARMESMASLTLSSMNLSFASGLLKYDRQQAELIPGRRRDPFNGVAEVSRNIMAASRRLGTWTAELSDEQLFAILAVRF
jgi:hypothetical protein